MLKKLFNESIIYSYGKVIIAFLGFATLPFLTRILSPDDFGIIVLLITISTFLTLIFGLSLESSLIRYYNDTNYKKYNLFEIILKFQILYGLILIILIIFISKFVTLFFNFDAYFKVMVIIILRYN